MVCRGGKCWKRFRPVQIRYSQYPFYFQYVDFRHEPFTSTLYIVSFGYARLRSARRIIGPPTAAETRGHYVMERTFKESWIQDTGLIAATLLNERGLSIVQWEGQLSGNPTIRPYEMRAVNE
jgi:hypothetical protein